MKIVLKVQLNIEGNRSTKGGEFNVRREEDIPQLAYDWVKYTKKETGYRKTIIEKVIWDEDNDITELVRQLDNAPIPDIDLPF